MFDENQYMVVPDDKDIKIWRYIDLGKFESLLKQRALYFCNSKCFKDNYEGSYSKNNKDVVVVMDDMGILENFHGKHRELNEIYRENVHINCWHMNDYENMAMWENYINGNEGIAIQSTYKRYGEAVMDDPNRMVYMGKVQYIDYNKEIVPYNEGLWANFLRKRKEFRYEQEIRAMYLLSQNKINDASITKGGFVSTDVETLIECVYLYPNSDHIFKEKVEKLIHSYGISLDVRNSSLSDEPTF
ncbi:hypothetical protein [Paenibacillus sp. FSL R5-0486]|uniref:hypothetical protein n=1 Tax=Paenibacillus sp. FSL R5-0486 TaxID=2921645 RepID=UPI0030DD600F